MAVPSFGCSAVNSDKADGTGNVPGGVCSASCNTILASEQVSPSGIAVDAEYVYWTTLGSGLTDVEDGTVMKVPLDGGTPTTVAAGRYAPGNIIVADGYLYWSEGYDLGDIVRIPVEGGEPTVLAADERTPGSIAVSGGTLYFLNGGFSGELKTMPIDGGTPISIASLMYPRSLIVDSANVYWISGSTSNSITKLPLEGGEQTAIANGLAEPTSIAVDEAFVYWADSGNVVSSGGLAQGSIRRAPLGGGTATTLVNYQSALRLAVNASGIYWTNFDKDGAVIASDLDGGNKRTLSDDERFPGAVVADGSSVYWTANGIVLSGAVGVVKKHEL